jgi:hypothetical protein
MIMYNNVGNDHNELLTIKADNNISNIVYYSYTTILTVLNN